MMGIHKISTGNGYTYLTDQVAAHDSTERAGQNLADYYSEKGERPGVWAGRGLDSLDGIDAGDGVHEAHMLALFGEGRHPNTDVIEADMRREGYAEKKIDKATLLGRPFRVYERKSSPFETEVAKRYQAWLKENGRRWNDSVPEDVRARIRGDVGAATFEEEHGRAPDERELNAHIARSTRPEREAVAGYDLTFSPVKSVSVLWALGDRDVAQAVSDAHDAAVAQTLEWIEDEVAFTRLGADGVRHVRTKGLIAATFVHRDSRAGEPDLHTHVAISNKVQADTGDPNDEHDGKWLALDGQVLYKATVAASERYNTLLERELNTRLGVRFTERETARGRRSVREIGGVPASWITRFSSRREQIESRTAQLQAAFRADHGRAPTPKEALALYQQATLETREKKHEPRSESEQRAAWREAVHELEGGDVDRVRSTLYEVVATDQPRTKRLNPQQITDLAAQVVRTVESHRAMFQADHLLAETLRRVRALELEPASEAAAIDAIMAACQRGENIVSLDAKDPVREPEALRRPDGTSVYERPRGRLFTTRETLEAERVVVDAAADLSTHSASEKDVAAALVAAMAAGKPLNEGQTHLVTEMATSGALVQLALAPAGAGKTTSMRALAAAWEESRPRSEGPLPGGGVLALAPTAVAAKDLGASINSRADTLAKLMWHLDNPQADQPEWMRQVGAGTLIIVDEAGMAATRDLARLVQFARSRDVVVRLVGDDQQLASIAAGGVLRDVAASAGTVSLTQLVRFHDPSEAAATLALRDGNAHAIGFYIDRDRVRVTTEGDVEEDVFAAWKQAQEEGHASLMFSSTRADVDALNERARAHRIASGEVDASREARLAEEARAGVGDLIVTRLNERSLRVTPTDFVKNGDRWRVTTVLGDGSVRARHEDLGTVVTLPADYLRENAALAYASTVHGAQGQTVHSAFLLMRGEESRQQVYVAMSRGTHLNQMFVPAGGQGDPHEVVREAATNPRVATEILEQVLARDGAQVSATTTRREAHDPRVLLKRNADRYLDAVAWASLRLVGPERVRALREQAEELVPGISDAPAWETLLANLAMIELSSGGAIEALEQAVEIREFDSAHDVAAVLDWRLDPDGNHNAGSGPLPWTPDIPHELREGEFADWLRERQEATARSKDEIRRIVRGWDEDTVPQWAREIYTSRPELTAQLLAWRSAHEVPDEDLSPAGPAHPKARQRRYQQHLEKQYDKACGGPAIHGQAFREDLQRLAPQVLQDVFWPVLARRLDAALAARLPVRERLHEAIASDPLPVEYAAAALSYRLIGFLEPAVAGRDTSLTRLRPPWTAALLKQLPEPVALRVMSDPAWPSLVAAVGHATEKTGLDGADVITRALDLIGRDALPTDTAPSGTSEAPRLDAAALASILMLRVGDLTTVVDDEEPIYERDLRDEDIDAYLRDLAAQDDRPRRKPVDATPPPAPEDDFDFVARDEDIPLEADEVPPDPEFDLGPIPEPEPVRSGVDEAAAARVVELTRAAGDFYAAAYPDSPAQAYLTKRFGTDLSETTFFVGYAGPERSRLTDHLRAELGATDDELVEAGLSKWRRGRLEDVFRNRALVGIHDRDGTLVGFNGRDLTGQHPAKYLNTPATPIFRKGAVLTGMHEGQAHAARREVTRPDIVGVEGPMDAIAVTLAGGGHVIGVAAGSGGFTTDQADQLAAYAARTASGTLWLAKDNDRAGRAALAKDAAALRERGIIARALAQPGAKDFSEAYENDPESVATILNLREFAPRAVRFVITDLAAEWDLARADIPTRVAGIRSISDLIAHLPSAAWETEIDHAARLFADPTHDADGYEHYALQLYDAVLVRALNWDMTTHEPGEHVSDLDAAADLTRLHEVLTNHNEPPVGDKMTQAIAKLRQRLEERQATQAPTQRRPRRTTAPSTHRQDRDTPRRDDPTQDGPVP